MAHSGDLGRLPVAVDTGFKNAESYDKSRPSFPSEAVTKLLKNIGVADQANGRIVELGAGTGKFTELLLAREEKFEVIAVEPHREMRESLKSKGLGDRLVIKDGEAVNTSIEEGWGDACIAAQVRWRKSLFSLNIKRTVEKKLVKLSHTFTDSAITGFSLDALKEIHRVLRPGAAFGMIWNIEDYNAPNTWKMSTQWEKTMNDITWSFDDSHMRFRHQKWKDVFDQQLDSTPLQTLRETFTQDFPQFSLPIGEDTVRWTVWLTEDGIWERYQTLSQIAVLKDQEKEDIKSRVFAALKGDDVERNEQGLVAVHGATYFAWTSRV